MTAELAPRPPIRTLGWAATAGSLIMYFPYIDRVQGEKGSVVLADMSGIILGGVAFLTAL